MDMGLKGRRALVTGSSAGLGRAIAEMLAAEGASVVVHGRDAERTEAVAAGIRAAGGDAMAVVGDLTTDAGADAVADAVGEVDILVNNAGAYDNGLPWSEVTTDMWTQIYATNVVSGVRMIERFVPRCAGVAGAASSRSGADWRSSPSTEQPHYQATLAARHNLTVSLARDLAGTGVTANIVAPGAILTGPVREMATRIRGRQAGGVRRGRTSRRAAVSAWVPNDIGRFGRPEEIAAAVVFLASAHAGYISGADIRVDGGTIRSVA